MMQLYTYRQQRAALLCLLLVVFALFANGQAVWNRTYIEDRATMLFSSVYADGSSYKVIGVTSGSISNQAKAMSGVINPAGVINGYTALGDSIDVNYGLFWNTLIKTSDNHLAFAGYYYDSISAILFVLATPGLDSIREFKYYTPNTRAFQAYSLLQYDDSAFYLAGVRTSDSAPSNPNVLLMKINKNGERIWERYYNQYKVDYARKLVKLANGNIMLGAVRNDANNTNEHANTWLLEVDTGGNFVRQWFDQSDSTYAAEGLKQTTDGGFIFGAQKKMYQVNSSTAYTASIVKVDSNFNKQWVYYGGVLGNFTGVVDIEVLNDGNYIVCGNYSNKEAWIIKLDTGGAVLWLKRYMGLQDTTPTWNILTDVDVLADGSLIAVGQCQRILNSNNLPPQVGWFLKLDSNGCEIENCTVGIDDISQKASNINLIIFYNQDIRSISFEAADMLGAEIKIYDLTGKVVYQGRVENYKESISIEQFRAGAYVLHLQKEGIMKHAKFVVY